MLCSYVPSVMFKLTSDVTSQFIMRRIIPSVLTLMKNEQVRDTDVEKILVSFELLKKYIIQKLLNKERKND